MSLEIRKMVFHEEGVWREGGRSDAGGALRKVAVLAIVRNPYAGASWSETLDDLVKPSAGADTGATSHRAPTGPRGRLR